MSRVAATRCEVDVLHVHPQRFWVAVVTPLLFVGLGSSCASGQLGTHGYSFDPPQKFRELAERGCRWDAAWKVTPSAEEDRYDYCMSRMGLREGRVRELSLWSPPSPEARPFDDMLECAEQGVVRTEKLDGCMRKAGFEFTPDRFIPYAETARAGARQVGDQLRACVSEPESQIDRFHMHYRHCLLERSWSVDVRTGR